MLRVVTGAPLFLIYLLYQPITLKRLLFLFTTYLAALIAHYIGRVALLYHNLSNCFDNTFYWKGRLLYLNFIKGRYFFFSVGFLICIYPTRAVRQNDIFQSLYIFFKPADHLNLIKRFHSENFVSVPMWHRFMKKIIGDY